jgi:hypothetical protein
MSKFVKFSEYLNTRGQVDEKGKVNDTGDEVDMPKPKAKEDPHKRPDKCACKKNKQPQVKEYLDGSGKLTEPIEQQVADYRGPDPSAPPQAGSNDLTKNAGKPAPYRPTNTSASAGGGESGFGDKGSKELKYEPNTEKPEKVVSTWPKTKTEEFVDKTRNMSLAEFAKYVIEQRSVPNNLPTVTTPNQQKFYPAPVEAVRYVGALTKNRTILNDLIHEVKRNGNLGQLLELALETPEGYKELVKLLSEEEGKKRCSLLARAMHEAVAPPIGLEDEEEEDDDEEVDSPFSKLDDEELDDLDDEEDDEMDDEEDMEDEDEMDGEMGDELDDEMGDEHPAAHKNMIGAMGRFGDMRKMMGM